MFVGAAGALGKIPSGKQADLSSGPAKDGVETPVANSVDDVYTEAKAAGIEIRTDADPEIKAYMDNAAKREGVQPEEMHAITIGDNIVVRESHASDVRVLREEMVHVQQQKDGQVEIGAGLDNRADLEIEAREELVRNADELGVSPSEVADLKKEIETIKQRGEY